ncbi:hypothetical protein S83_069811 [Arachis hypogaea]
MQRKAALPLRDTKSGNANKMKALCGKEALVKLLRWHFGYPNFRGKQLDAIQVVLLGRDCLCLMPIGGGKSMCYQIPALAKTGIVLVVCPLIGTIVISDFCSVDALMPGTFDLVGTILYEIDRHPYQNTFFNGTIEVTEAGVFLSMKYVLLVTLGIALLVLLGLWIHGQI